MKTILFMSCLMISTYCFSQAGKTKTINGANYKISYPASWRLDTSKNMGTELIFYSPVEGADDKFTENVNLVIQNLKGRNMDLKKYQQITEQQLKEMGGEGKLFLSTILKKNNIPYYRLDHQMKQGERNLRFISMCFLKNEKAYLMTFTTTVDSYLRYKNTGEAILQSFLLTK